MITTTEIDLFDRYLRDDVVSNPMVGMSVVMTYHHEIIYSKGFGYRKLNPKKRITPDTIMSIQSITKSFAATTIMYLVEKNMIDLDEPLITYLPYFQTKNKKKSDSITVRQLLSHTAGFLGDIKIANLVCTNRTEIEGFKKWQEELGISNETINNIKSFEDITRYFKRIELAYAPGQGWKYCTDAYAIVGDLFEKVSGKSWHDYVLTNIFNKCGMTRSTLDPVKAKEDKDSARYYVMQEEVAFPTNPIAAPIGFIYSTANDMAKYLNAYMMDESPILTDKSIKEMKKKYFKVKVDLPNIHLEDMNYGLGWVTGKYKGQEIIEHGGGYTGVRSYVMMVPNEKLGIVVLTNYNEAKPVEICRKVLDLFLY